jgi:hypothetical protein
MGAQLTFDENNDRIVEINGFELCVHDNFRFDRRNVICYSFKLQLYSMLKGLRKDNYEHSMLIGDLLNNNTFDDNKITAVKGYY